MKISRQQAFYKLLQSKQEFIELFKHGSLSVEIYKPEKTDKQTPHSRDEVYIIIAGSGEFMNGNDRTHFTAGDFLFVPAGVEHRFIDFSEDFCTWVIFYGPEGGEKEISN
ncbi:MAG: cupin domain-containing protein [Ferruginibacter sp.]